MKKGKKLTLNRETIASLDRVRGGDDPVQPLSRYTECGGESCAIWSCKRPPV